MHESCALRGALLALGVAALVTAARAEPVPHGNEFLVNSYTSDSQRNPQVAAAADGSFVVVWDSYAQDGDGRGVFAQRFDASGVLQGSELQVNGYTSGRQEAPGVAVDADGDFVVVFVSYRDGSDGGVFAQRFDASGARQGIEFQINTFTANEQSGPVIGMRSGGGFVVVWRGDGQDGSGRGVFGRRFDASGSALGVEFQVNSSTAGYQGYASLAVNGDGSFAVVWVAEEQDGSVQGVFGQRFSSAGARLGIEFQVNSSTFNEQTAPSIAADGGGQFVVAWHGSGISSAGIFGQRFSAGGQRLGTEFQVNAGTLQEPFRPSVARQVSGEFVVVWDATIDNYSVFGRRFGANGTPAGGDFKVNTYDPYLQFDTEVVSNRNGGFVVVWESRYQDDNSYGGIFGQLYLQDLTLDVDGDGSFLPLTDGLLLLRYAFGFRGAVLIASAVGGGCTRCTAAEIEDYLGSI